MTAARSNKLAARAAVAYAVLILYGSLFPFSGFSVDNLHEAVSDLWPSHISKTDLLTNLLIYFPLGFLAGMAFRGRFDRAAARVLAILCGFCLSLFVESVQLFLPRVSSWVDLMANTSGAVVGAVVGSVFDADLPLGDAVRALRRWLLKPGRLSEIGFATILIWVAAQLSPFVPSADWGNIKHGLKPAWYALWNPSLIDTWGLCYYALASMGLALLVKTTVRRDVPWRALSLFLFGSVLVLKVPIITRQLSLHAGIGVAVGLAIAFQESFWRRKRVTVVGAGVSLLLAYTLDSLAPALESDAFARSMNWIPFDKNRLNLFDFSDLLDTVWVFWGLAYLVAIGLWQNRVGVARVVILGAVVIGASTLMLEGMQLMVPGRVPDVTDSFIAVMAWMGPWMILGWSNDEGPS